MSTGRVLRRLLCAAALALFALPAAASAQAPGLPLPLLPGAPPQLRAMLQSRAAPTGSTVPRRFVDHQLHLRAQHGYLVYVIGIGNEVMIEVGRRNGHAISAYVVKGKVTPTGLSGDFGELGRVSLRFRPDRGPGSVHTKLLCRGVPLRFERDGVYSGTVRFRGEDGYVAVRSHRARGQRKTAATRCGPRRSRRSTQRANSSRVHRQVKLPRALFASSRSGVDVVEMLSFTTRDKVVTVAMTAQSLGSMGVFHLAYDKAAPRVFALDDALTRANLSPTRPFSGSGFYRAAPDGTRTWDGTLAVSFPGAPKLPLAGPGFEAELEAAF